MYRLIFQNSKIALAFAILTIVGAVSIVGTPEDSGVVTQAAAIAQAAGSQHSGGAAKVVGGRRAGPSIFGEYNSAGSANGDARVEAPVPGDTLVIEPLK